MGIEAGRLARDAHVWHDYDEAEARGRGIGSGSRNCRGHGRWRSHRGERRDVTAESGREIVEPGVVDVQLPDPPPARRAAAASLDAPPRPAAAGMRLARSRRAAPGWSVSSRRRRSERRARLSLPAREPSSQRARDQGTVERVRRSERSMVRKMVAISWKPSSRRPITSSPRFSLAGAR